VSDIASDKLSIVLVGAHPDDEIAAAGVLSKYRRAGHRVAIVTMTKGGMGHMTIPSEELRRIRVKEGQAAAKAIGAEIRFLDHEDSAVPHTREAALRLAEIFRELKPDIVLTHNPDSAHPDHRNTGYNVTDGFYLASLPLLVTSHPWHNVKEIYFFSDGEDRDIFIDITDTIETKIEAMRCHKSQFDGWLMEHQGGLDRAGKVDLYEQARMRCRAMGYKAGVAYAEGFKPFFKKTRKALDYLPI